MPDAPAIFLKEGYRRGVLDYKRLITGDSRRGAMTARGRSCLKRSAVRLGIFMYSGD
jgi:hypothetical protein